MPQLFQRLHRETPLKAFQTLGIEAFEATFRALFEQANTQAARLHKFNDIISELENALFSQSAIDELTTAEKLALFESVVEQATALTGSLVTLSKPLANVRLIIATLDGLKAHQVVEELRILKDANPAAQALPVI
jgi:hypothetical protein